MLMACLLLRGDPEPCELDSAYNLFTVGSFRYHVVAAETQHLLAEIIVHHRRRKQHARSFMRRCKTTQSVAPVVPILIPVEDHQPDGVLANGFNGFGNLGRVADLPAAAGSGIDKARIETIVLGHDKQTYW